MSMTGKYRSATLRHDLQHDRLDRLFSGYLDMPRHGLHLLVSLALAAALPGCLLVPQSSPPAQLGMIIGVVTDGAGNPIANADVEYGRLDGQIIPGTGLGTDQAGRYSSRALLIGGYRVSVSAVGWISQIQDVLVQEDNPTVVNFILEPSVK